MSTRTIDELGAMKTPVVIGMKRNMSTRTIDELGAMKTPVVIGMKRKDTGCSIESEF